MILSKKLTRVDVAKKTNIHINKLNYVVNKFGAFEFDECLKLSNFFNVDKELFFDDYLNFLYTDYKRNLLNLLEQDKALTTVVCTKLNYTPSNLFALLTGTITFQRRSHFNRVLRAIKEAQENFKNKY